MSWAEFIVIVSGLVTVIFLLVAWPWVRHKQSRSADVLTNVQIVRQRLAELDREEAEGVISHDDKEQASRELKLALVEEHNDAKANSVSRATLPLTLGAVLAIVAGVWVYGEVNHIDRVSRSLAAIESLPALSDKLASGNGSNFTQDDVTDLTYAIRQRLRAQPDDATGWMFLGRLWMSVGQDVQALQALERAVELQPDDASIKLSYAQVLMTIGEAEQLRKAQSVLTTLISESPNNDNLALMLAVVSAKLGDLDATKRYYAVISDKLPPDHEMLKNLEARIVELERQAGNVPNASTQESDTGFNIKVSVSKALARQVPENGYLVVYAQDANSNNRMPAAVVKMPLKDFPVTLSLTNKNAMMAGYSLSELDTVRLVARISKDEDVMPSTGDLLGELTVPVVPGELPNQSIEINKELM